MKRTTWFYLCTAMAALALGGFFIFGAWPADAVPGFDECGACGGSLQSVTGSAASTSCSQALSQAYLDALSQAHANAPASSPCQITNGPTSCYGKATIPPSPNPFTATWQLNYRTQACDPGEPMG